MFLESSSSIALLGIIQTIEEIANSTREIYVLKNADGIANKFVILDTKTLEFCFLIIDGKFEFEPFRL